MLTTLQTNPPLSEEHLLERRVLLVGAGGLGFACAFAIAEQLTAEPLRAQVTCVVMDGDTIELSNLNRQLLFTAEDVGRYKCELLCHRVGGSAAVRFEPLTERLTEQNAGPLLAAFDLVIDCTDSVQTKLMLNDLAVQRDLPFVYGGAIGLEGVALLRPGAGNPCLRCLFGDFNSEELATYGATCSRAGILGPIAGMVGVLQAQLALSWLAAPKEATAALFAFSAANPSLRRLTPPSDPECSIGCATHRRTRLDLTAERCPMTFLYTKLALEELQKGGVLEVDLHDEATSRSVMKSVEEAGYRALSAPIQRGADLWRIVIHAAGRSQ